MDFKQSHSIQQTQKLEHVISQQQIHAIKILAVQSQELQTIIEQEVAVNPVLEMTNPDEITSLDKATEDFNDNVLKIEYDNIDESFNSNYNPDLEGARQYYFDSITTNKSMLETLYDQIRLLDLTAKMEELVINVLSEIDHDGYIASEVSELVRLTDAREKDIKRALDIIQQLEPVGIGTRNLDERLLLQLRRLENYDPIAERLIKESLLTEVAANHIPQLAKKMSVSIGRIEEAIEVIKSLKPVLSVEQTQTNYIQEDITVVKKSGEFQAVINHCYEPKIHISDRYMEMLESKHLSKDEKSYILEKIRSAQAIITALADRETTIKKVADRILFYQKEFFEQGVSALLPLTRAQIATDIDYHETTISRAVNNKYLSCQFGTFPLSFFFSSAITKDNNTSDVASTSVKEVIRELINEEDKYKPLSDSKLEKILQEQGYNIARRTVAKYRDSMDIPTASLRKKHR